MNIFNYVKKWIVDTKNMCLQYNLDKKYKKQFQEVIREAYEDRESDFNKKFNLKTDNNFLEIALVIDIPEQFQIKGADWQIMDKLNESTYFVTMYLQQDLGFNGYVTYPKYFHIEDPASDGNVSCTYLATWNFAPKLTKKYKIKLLSRILGVFATLSILISSVIFYIL